MEKLFKQLSDIQATLFVLFHKTWIYHWNVVGSDFYQLHELFGKQYETMFEEIDRLTEHMRFLGMKPVSTLTRITEVTHINQASNSAEGINAKTMVKQLLGDNQVISEMLIDASNSAERVESLATANILQDILETHGKFVWMLRSISETSKTSSVEDIAVEAEVEQQPEVKVSEQVEVEE